jgi:hypothetical protein
MPYISNVFLNFNILLLVEKFTKKKFKEVNMYLSFRLSFLERIDQDGVQGTVAWSAKTIRAPSFPRGTHAAHTGTACVKKPYSISWCITRVVTV